MLQKSLVKHRLKLLSLQDRDEGKVKPTGKPVLYSGGHLSYTHSEEECG